MIRADKLIKRFSQITALDGVNAEIPKGAVYALVGSNGSGKSTFMRTAAGVYKPDSGTVTLGGAETYENVSIKQRTYFVPDTPFFIMCTGNIFDEVLSVIAVQAGAPVIIAAALFFKQVFAAGDAVREYSIGTLSPLSPAVRLFFA